MKIVPIITAPHLQNIIWQTAQRSQLDIDAPAAYLRLEDDDAYKTLVIEKTEKNLLRVGQYCFDRNDDWIAHPEVTFFIGDDEWIPLTMMSPGSGFCRGGSVSSDGSHVIQVKAEVQAEIAEFCEEWVRELDDQDWSQAVGFKEREGSLRPTSTAVI